MMEEYRTNIGLNDVTKINETQMAYCPSLLDARVLKVFKAEYS